MQGDTYTIKEQKETQLVDPDIKNQEHQKTPQ